MHETIIFIHIYMPTHKHIHRYMYKYISKDILTRSPILILENEICKLVTFNALSTKRFTRKHNKKEKLVRWLLFYSQQTHMATWRWDRIVVVCWLLNVPATSECISGTDLLRQFDVLPHCVRKLQTKLYISPSHSILTPGRPVPALTL